MQGGETRLDGGPGFGTDMRTKCWGEAGLVSHARTHRVIKRAGGYLGDAQMGLHRHWRRAGGLDGPLKQGDGPDILTTEPGILCREVEMNGIVG